MKKHVGTDCVPNMHVVEKIDRERLSTPSLIIVELWGVGVGNPMKLKV